MHSRKKKSGCLFVVFAFIVSVLASQLGSSVMSGIIKKSVRSVASGPSLILIPENSDTPVSIDTEDLHSAYAILVRLSDKTVLIQKQGSERIYPISLMKMMTTVVAIENIPDLQRKIELSSSIFQPLYRADVSMAGFLPGGKAPTIDLLYGALLSSGAERCIGLTDEIPGSGENFVKKVNQKTDQLSTSDIYFTNSTGLQNENHYSTVKDLSLLLDYTLQNQTFRETFTSSRHSIAATNKHPDGITFISTLSQNPKDQTLPGGEILGRKTGFTDGAGLCLASLAQIDGKEYILVTAGAEGDHKTEPYDIDDTREVYQRLN